MSLTHQCQEGQYKTQTAPMTVNYLLITVAWGKIYILLWHKNCLQHNYGQILVDAGHTQRLSAKWTSHEPDDMRPMNIGSLLITWLYSEILSCSGNLGVHCMKMNMTLISTWVQLHYYIKPGNYFPAGMLLNRNWLLFLQLRCWNLTV